NALLEQLRIGARGHVLEAFLDHGLAQHRGGGGAVASHVVGLVATSLRSWAPIFSKGSSSSISRAMVTPSLVMVGEPHFFNRAPLRPLRLRATLPELASTLTHRSRAWRASSPSPSSLPATCTLLPVGLDGGSPTAAAGLP